MTTSLGQSEHIARKTHQDNGDQYFDFLTTRDENKRVIVDPKEAIYLKLSEDEIKTIQHSIDSKWVIGIGEVYVKQTSVDDGYFWTYKTRKEIHQICEKYSLYQED
jgi:hypothetical protein